MTDTPSDLDALRAEVDRLGAISQQMVDTINAGVLDHARRTVNGPHLSREQDLEFRRQNLARREAHDEIRKQLKAARTQLDADQRSTEHDGAPLQAIEDIKDLRLDIGDRELEIMDLRDEVDALRQIVDSVTKTKARR